MKLFLLAIYIGAVIATAQPALGPPQLGYIADGNHSLRPLLGVAGSLYLSGSIAEDVISSASSGSYTVVKTGSSVLVFNGLSQTIFEIDADAGPALFAFLGDGSPALVYLPQSGTLLSWKTDRLEPLAHSAVTLRGDVVAMAPGAFIVRRRDGLWKVDILTGTQSALGGVTGPVLFAIDGSLLYADGTNLAIRDVNGLVRRIDTGIVISGVRLLGSGWVQVFERDSSRPFAVRFIPGREQVSQLPEAQ